MNFEEQMAIVIEVMEDRSLPNRPSCRVKRMRELGLDVSHSEMVNLWKRYRYESMARRYVGHIPMENPF